MSFDIPASIESDVQKYATTWHLSMDEAIVTLLKAGLKDSSSGFDYVFTPERLTELDEISKEIKDGGERYSLDQVEAHFAKKGDAWRANHPN